MFNKHVMSVVRSELAALGNETLLHVGQQDDPHPERLHVLVDAPMLQLVLEKGDIRAPRLRFAGEASPQAYGLPLIKAFLEERHARARGRIRTEFAWHLLTHFCSSGREFNRYIARFFENGAAVLERDAGLHGYLLGIRSAGLGMRPGGSGATGAFLLHRVIYDAREQQRLIGGIYHAYELYFRRAIERFGEHSKDDILPFCWSSFQRVAGDVCARLRNPGLADEREWIALAPYQPPTGFDIENNTVVPWLALRLQQGKRKALPLDCVLIHEAVPGMAELGVRELLRANRAFTVAISRLYQAQQQDAARHGGTAGC